MTIPVWFEATRAGEFEIGCAELCGLGHYRMKARVFIHERADYEAWLGEQIAAQEGSGETEPTEAS